jgi:parvulin-like peptidyl-prolyl isomerase
MMTRKFIALAIGALALLAAGCSSADIAATVNGSEIEESYVLGLRTDTEDQVSVSADQFRNDLSAVIFTEALLTAVEDDFGLTDLDSTDSRTAYLASADPREQEYLASVADDPTLSESAVDLAVTQLLVRSEVIASLTSDETILENIWQNSGGAFMEVCASHILVATEGEALDVMARLEAGESFSTVADDVSLDDVSVGGALPCPVSPSAFVGPFGAAVATAPVGEATGPVQTEFGWHVILVDSREGPQSAADLAEDPERWLSGEATDALWNGWINDVVASAVIVVRTDIGTWVQSANGILPPPQSP